MIDDPATGLTIDSGSPLLHRFALSLCGGISPGAYEAGVVTQLYRDIRSFNAHPDVSGKLRVCIEAISGTSAGAITGLILARGIGLNLDADELERRMRICWIELLDITNLLSLSQSPDNACSIYSDHVYDEIIARTLHLPADHAGGASDPVALWITMTNLDGIPFAVDFTREGHAQPGSCTLYARDYKDYVPFVISGASIRMASPRMLPDPDQVDEETWRLAAAAARGSSAFPLVFPLSSQMRDLTQYKEYAAFVRSAQREGWPVAAGGPQLSGQFQFADGSLFTNQPIGRCIEAVAYLDQLPQNRAASSPERPIGRSFVVIDRAPHPPASVERTADGELTSTLPTAILGKMIAAYSTSSVYSDFRVAEQTNRTIRRLHESLAMLDELDLPSAKIADLKHEILSAAGFEDKHELTLQRIPMGGASRRLAGEFAGNFGGFFRSDYREADFMTGCSESRDWFAEWLMLWMREHSGEIGVVAEQIDAAYIANLLGDAPPDPGTTPIPPTELTPRQLGSADWFPRVDDEGRISYVDRLAALNANQRREIVQQAESRLLLLLESWFHVPAVLARPESFIVSHFVGPKLIDEPDPEKS